MIDLLSDVTGIDLRGGQVLSGFVSRHSAPPRPGSGLTEWNEKNVGLGYKTANGFLLLPYLNSENGVSVLGAYEAEVARTSLGPNSSAGIRLGVGVALGYKEMPIAPAAYPSAFVGYGKWEVVLGHCQSPSKRFPSVTWLQLRYDFD